MLNTWAVVNIDNETCLEHFKERTLPIHMYSIATDRTLIASVTQIATRAEAVEMEEMTNGPINLQKRSIRRIRALSTWTRG